MIKVNGNYVSKLFRLRLKGVNGDNTMDVFCCRWASFNKGIICYYSSNESEYFYDKDWYLTDVQEF